ncbi:hypothetical protein NFI96_031918 [Prochilodus magdalenae]|nr:hypothetical protein NFI96_031918 [Prochilodus magdalenae]
MDYSLDLSTYRVSCMVGIPQGRSCQLSRELKPEDEDYPMSHDLKFFMEHWDAMLSGPERTRTTQAVINAPFRSLHHR